ncbi:MAG TPA: chorismate-binding protein [Allosphingosinicella sp.]|nr:chorismate-binding protein [Allosphingosinicella sp.]
MKGTRSRGDTPESDRAAAAALGAAAKDRAEHVMIVDLERNDLGRVCRASAATASRRDRPFSIIRPN